MESCHGKTKAGKRCRRSPSGDSGFCSAHQDQAPTPPNETPPRRARSDRHRGTEEYDSIDRLWGIVTLGLVVGALFALRGSLRIF